MPEITTVTVHPDRAERLRQFRDEHNLSSMDAALDKVLEQKAN